MVDIGTAPGSTNTAKIIVSENHPGTMLIIGADTGAPDGPARKIDVFEDVEVHGNACVGEMKMVRARWPQGTDGSISEGVDDEVPRIQKLAGDERLHIIGGGPLSGPGRDIVLWDDVRVVNDLTVANDLSVNNNATVVGNLTVNTAAVVGTTLTVNGTGPHTLGGGVDLAPSSDVNVGNVTGWGRVFAENAVYAAGTFHVYNRGVLDIIDFKCGFGFDVTPASFGLNVVSAQHVGINVAMLHLDDTIECASVVVTPWILGQYNEAVAMPVLVAPCVAPCMMVAPGITVKGFPVSPNGVLPTATTCPVQQIEIAFWELDNCATDFVPTAPVELTPGIDLVFDVKICGCACISA